MPRPPLVALAALAATAAAACDAPLDTTTRRTYADFGTEMFGVLHDEALWSGDPVTGATRAAALTQRKEATVWALNALVAPPVDDAMLPLLERLLPLYAPRPGDLPGFIPSLTRDTAALLRKLTADPGAVAALAKLLDAPGAHTDAVERLVGRLARHPVPLTTELLSLTLALEPQLTALFTHLHAEWAALPDPTGPRLLEVELLQRLLWQRLLVLDEPTGPPALVAQLDVRGAPLVTRDAEGALPAPFADLDDDGAPDADPLGRLTGADGAPLDLPPVYGVPTAGETRDQLGRAFLDGQLVYTYFDARESLLAWALRDVRALLASGVHYDLFTAFEGLLGPRAERSDAAGTYSGFQVWGTPLLELLHATNELRRYPRLVPLLRALEHVATQREPLVRALVLDLAKARPIFADAPSLAPGHLLIEELHPLLEQLAEQGLLRALLAAATEPATHGLPDALAAMMRHTDLAWPSSLDALKTPTDVDALPLVGQVPWDQDDLAPERQSLFQKFLTLIDDTAWAPVALKLFDEIPLEDLLVTESMAHLYVTAIGGQAVLDMGNGLLNDAAVAMLDEFDDLHLTPRELNLFMNHDQKIVGNPVCLQGFQVRQHMGPMLFALQRTGMLDAVTPWVTRVVEAGQADLFVQLQLVLARHWGETARDENGFESAGTAGRRVEPTLVRLVDETDLLEHALELFAWAHAATLEVDGQVVNVGDELDALLRWLLATDVRITTTAGATKLPANDGQTLLQNPSRLQHLLWALDGLDRALAEHPDAQAAWDRADVAGHFLDLEDSPKGPRLRNRHTLEVVLRLLPVLADLTVDAVTADDWTATLDDFLKDTNKALSGRGFAATFDLLARLRDDASLRARLDALVAAFLAEEPVAPSADLFGGLLEVASVMTQIRSDLNTADPLLRFVGRAVDPDERLLFRAAEGLLAVRAEDAGDVFGALVRNAMAEEVVGVTPYKALKEAIEAIARANPLQDGPLSAADLTLVLTRLSDWLTDGERGAERLYTIIGQR